MINDYTGGQEKVESENTGADRLNYFSNSIE